MALLDNITQSQYYQGNNLGHYQFTSLDDIINQFMFVYVGDKKAINKVDRTEVQFHAMRALAELSFDTLKSIKAQEIVVPATLQMILPHDYVKYTKISWVDSSGIKHPIYPTKHTSNPLDLTQDADGNYSFPSEAALGVNMDFEQPLISPWQNQTPSQYFYGNNNDGYTYYDDTISLVNGALTFVQHPHNSWTHNKSKLYCVWQPIDVADIETLHLSAIGTTQGAITNVLGGDLKIGISPTPPDPSTDITYPNSSAVTSNLNLPWNSTLNGNDGVLEWGINESAVTKSLVDDDAIDVSAYSTVYVIITSMVDFTTTSTTADAVIAATTGTNSIDTIIITNPTSSLPLATNSQNSSDTWDNYKSQTPSENNNDDYEDDVYWPAHGERYGLEPSHAQVNGSFYIDEIRGKIHFSSNISGKTVILDYISDSLGTEKEMQVHKFAEEAIYKSISYGILSSRLDVPEYVIRRYKKEKFAETRKAKLRLSNIKLEELTQILRGKSKQIKH